MCFGAQIPPHQMFGSLGVKMVGEKKSWDKNLETYGESAQAIQVMALLLNCLRYLYSSLNECRM